MSNPKAANAVRGLRSCRVLCFALAWTAGLLAAFLNRSAVGLTLGSITLAVFLCTFLPTFRRFRENRVSWLCMTVGLLCGIAAWVHYDSTVRQPMLRLDGETQTLTGRVIHSKAYNNDRAVYTLRTQLAGHRAAVDWYASADVPALQIGDTVTLEAALTRIDSDYRFQTAEYQAGRGKYLRIYSADIIEIQKDTHFSLSRALHAYRQRITKTIERRLSPDSAALMTAMLFGDKSKLDQDDADALYQTGIGHIMAVSGLHLVFFCTLLTRLLGLLHTSARFRFFANAGAMALFILLVDGSSAVWRAALMLLLAQSAALFGRHRDTLHSLGIAMFLCTLFTPYVIGAVSFWLSVSGVFGVGVLAPHMTRDLQCSRFCRHLPELCCVSAAVFPASVLLLGEGSLLSPIANLLILPFAVIALYIGFVLLCTGGLTAFLLPAADILCRFILAVTGFLARLPFSHVTVYTRTVRGLVLVCALTLLLLLALGVKRKHIVAAFFVSAILLAGEAAFAKHLDRQMLQIAVLGQKKQAAAVILYDGAVIVADFSDAVRNPQYVQKFLRDYGITEADLLLRSGGKSEAAYLAVPAKSEYLAAGDIYDVAFGALQLSYTGDTMHLTWNGLTVSVLPAEDASPAEAAVIVRYGGAPAASDTCAMRLCPALDACTPPDYGENNQLIRLSADGHGEITPLQ